MLQQMVLLAAGFLFNNRTVDHNNSGEMACVCCLPNYQCDNHCDNHSCAKNYQSDNHSWANPSQPCWMASQISLVYYLGAK